MIRFFIEKLARIFAGSKKMCDFLVIIFDFLSQGNYRYRKEINKFDLYGIVYDHGMNVYKTLET